MINNMYGIIIYVFVYLNISSTIVMISSFFGVADTYSLILSSMQL